jgi:hypothetical protein
VGFTLPWTGSACSGCCSARCQASSAAGVASSPAAGPPPTPPAPPGPGSSSSRRAFRCSPKTPFFKTAIKRSSQSVLRFWYVYPGPRIRILSIPEPGSASKNLSILTQKLFLSWFPIGGFAPPGFLLEDLPHFLMEDLYHLVSYWRICLTWFPIGGFASPGFLLEDLPHLVSYWRIRLT